MQSGTGQAGGEQMDFPSYNKKQASHEPKTRETKSILYMNAVRRLISLSKSNLLGIQKHLFLKYELNLGLKMSYKYTGVTEEISNLPFHAGINFDFSNRLTCLQIIALLHYHIRDFKQGQRQRPRQRHKAMT